jgi:hypothetical protein
MKVRTLIILLVTGGLAVWFELQPIYRYGLTEIQGRTVSLYILCILLFIATIRAVIRFRRLKKISTFIPPAVGLVSLLIVIFHARWRSDLENSPSIMLAHTSAFGTDGGLALEFKKDNHVVAELRNRIDLTRFWGRYQIKQDTVYLDLPVDFNLGKKGILADNRLLMIDSKVSFKFHLEGKPYE